MFSPSPTVPPVTSLTLLAAAPGLGPVCLPEQESSELAFSSAAQDVIDGCISVQDVMIDSNDAYSSAG